MRIKAYSAESVAEALKQVRSEMGADAFLLKTRKSVGQLGAAQVEVTACIGEEQPFQLRTQQSNSVESNRIKNNLQDEAALTKNNSSPNSSVDLSAVHDRLDAIEGMLAALISQMSQGHSN